MADFGTTPHNIAGEVSATGDRVETPETADRNGEARTPEDGSARVETNGSIPSPAAEGSLGAAPSSAETEGKDEAPSRVDRAEEIVDKVAAKVATWSSFLGRKIVKGTSRLREAAQDFWAEAQNIRRGKQE
jgi:hypothetical protein